MEISLFNSLNINIFKKYLKRVRMVKNPSYYVFRKWPFALLISRKEDSQGGGKEKEVKYRMGEIMPRTL